MDGPERPGKTLLCFAVFSLLVTQVPVFASAGGFLSAIREDVRSPKSADRPAKKKSRDESGRRYGGDGFDDHDDPFAKVLFLGAWYTITSPFWGPVAALDDSYKTTAYFDDYPYANDRDGILVFQRKRCDCGALLSDSEVRPDHEPWCAWHGGSSKRFSGRFTAEWAEQPGDMSRIGGRLQLSTSSRFGLDTQMDWLREPSSGPLDDQLWLGDCNVVFRFAQSERAQFYSGIGFNWLDDPIDTNFGFNFTYGVDLFPARPWILSSSIDWGQLGHANQFRFRTTAGLMINRVEVFAGYEYLDIDRTQINTYVAGVGIWF